MSLEDKPFPTSSSLPSNYEGGSSAPASWQTILGGPNLIAKHRGSVPVTELEEFDVIGLYFSAHWCPPCRQFTPVLNTIYNATRHKSFEVVFVSHDKQVADAYTYWNTGMSFPAIPFNEHAQLASVIRRFSVIGIPSLILLSKTGEIIDSNAVSKIKSNSNAFIALLPDRPVTTNKSKDKNGKTGDNGEGENGGKNCTRKVLPDEVNEMTLEGVLEQLDENEEKIVKLTTIRDIAGKIIDNEKDLRYRVLKKQNKSVHKKLADRKLVWLLKLAGFDEFEDRFEFPPDAETDKLQTLQMLCSCIIATSGGNEGGNGEGGD